MPASPARRAAFDVLLAIETRDAFVDEVLHGRRLQDLSERDRALATELTLGALRRRGELDSLLEQAAGRPLAALDAEVRAALRLGAYQLLHLDRVPGRAAVFESVELVKRGPRRKAAGLVNAALRRLPPPPPAERARELNYPTWLVERWRRFYGSAAEPLLETGLHPAPTFLRLNPAEPWERTRKRLADEGVRTEPTESLWALRLVGGKPQATSCWAEGLIRIQDLSSQLVAPLLEARAVRRTLDLCAAPGLKTAQLVELRGGSAGLVAADLHLHRLRLMRRLQPTLPPLTALDATQPLPFRTSFDRILVDAPCSGTGTLARNPDIKWRLRPDDLPELAARQRAILNRALDALAPGGALVYATCSLEPEENAEVVEAVLAERPGWRITRRLERLPGRDPGDGFFAFRIER